MKYEDAHVRYHPRPIALSTYRLQLPSAAVNVLSLQLPLTLERCDRCLHYDAQSTRLRLAHLDVMLGGVSHA